MESSAFPCPGPSAGRDVAGAGAGTEVSVSGEGAAVPAGEPADAVEGAADADVPLSGVPLQPETRPAATARNAASIRNFRIRPPSLRPAILVAWHGQAGRRPPGSHWEVAAISPIMEACSSVTWSRVNPSRSIMVPG